MAKYCLPNGDLKNIENFDVYYYGSRCLSKFRCLSLWIKIRINGKAFEFLE